MVSYDDKLPINTFKDSYGLDFNTEVISSVDANIISIVVEDYYRYSHYYVNPYTFLVTGCLYHNLDLIDNGYLSI